MLNIVNEIGEEGRSIEDLKNDYPDKFKNFEALNNFMGENDRKVPKQNFLIIIASI